MRTFLTFLLLFATLLVEAQPTSDGVVPISVSVQTNPAQVHLSWNLPDGFNFLQLFRREKEADVWYIFLEDSLSVHTSYVDTLVEAGKTYEYGIYRQNNGWLNAFGYVTVPVEAPLVEQRGTLLVFVEEALMLPLESELDRLNLDLIGDGWRVVWHSVPAGATVADVKDQIVADYNSGDFPNLNSVLLFGNIPVPYSGNTNWDGHDDHTGAWPADVYYGDATHTWSDISVNNTTPTRPENDNVPGDGKFDPSTAPTATELAVGRVDFSNLDEATWGTTRTELYRRYLDKNHNWRTKKYTVNTAALVDDNFGFFGGQAFAANGYRNGYPLVGAGNVTEGDFFNDTDSQSFLFAYACGGGTYTSADGVGNSTNFATDSINAVFTMLFGSYHGDWDYTPNPFMPSALASKGGILSVAWAGRPHWFSHHLGAGETLGYTALATQNACDNAGYFGSYGECGAHVSLLGDPTLRAQIIAPVHGLAAAGNCATVELTWAAASPGSVMGYHVYRSAQFDGEFERLTAEPVATTSFTDDVPLDGEQVYMVRAVALETTPSGKFFNASTGAFTTIDFSPSAAPSIVATGGTIDCNQTSVELTSLSDVPDGEGEYEWTSPGGDVFSGQNLTVSEGGIYSVQVTHLLSGCTAITQVTVDANTDPPGATASATAINCAVSIALLAGSSPAPAADYEWSGPGGFISNLPATNTTEPGNYLLTVTGTNGCTSTASVEVAENTTPPDAYVEEPTGLDCAQLTTQLYAGSSVLDAIYSWTGPDGFVSNEQNPVVTQSGNYFVEVTDPANGCSTMAAANVVGDFTAPQASAMGGVQTCANPQVQLTGSSTTPGATFQWTGPFGYVSNEQNPLATGPGSYLLTVTNPANGCTATASAEVTTSGDVPVASPSDGVITCDEPAVTLTANPNAAGYNFLWLGPNGFTSTEENPVVDEPGVYILTVTNPATGCSGVYSTFVYEDTTLPLISIPPVTLTCGVSSFVLTCPPAPGLECAWFDSAGNEIPAGTIISSSGTYTLVLTSPGTGCTTSADLVVMQNTTTPNLEVTGDLSIACFGETTTLTAISTTPAAQYFWVGNVGIPIQPQQTVTAGTYTVLVTDASNGCTASQTVVVTQPPVLTATVISTVNCDGSEDIGVAPTGGSAPYIFEVMPGFNVPANTAYTVLVTDANGCTWSTQGTTGSGSDLAATATHTDETSFGAFDGTATAQGSNGVPPYDYLWSNGATTPVITDLVPDTYTCTVTDATGCTTTVSVTILPGPDAATEIPGLRLLNLSPNPTAGQFGLTLELETAAELSIVLQDLTGKILEKTPVEMASAGSWRFDLSGYPAGVYVCKVQVGGRFSVLRVVKM